MRPDIHLTALKALQAIILSLAVLLICSPAYGDRQLLILTEEWPPYNFRKDGEVVGLSTDLVKAMLARAQIDYRLEVWPWKRAYTTTLKQPDTSSLSFLSCPATSFSTRSLQGAMKAESA